MFIVLFLFYKELFQAYKIGTETIDQNTLQQHLHMAKEIEKKVSALI